MNTFNGKISISWGVVEKLAAIATTECYGIVGMANKSVGDEIINILNIDNITKGVKLKFFENKFSIDLHIIVKYGTNINTVSETIINTVKYKVEKYTDIKIDNINVFVEGIKVID